ncbi:MAG TPA: glutamate-1-semialdehyde 2,1-aminomutase [Gemmatimonadaceae bacterium]|nr:glutamate-1-semialdehyde 2,1-aminomutase [Gemmatimonadaceae bacterium]
MRAALAADSSAGIMARARELFPGGVSSPVRAFRGVGGDPFVAASGKGAVIRDVDGNEYIDFVMSWGALALGHADDSVLSAIEGAARNGTTFGTPTRLELELAELIVAAMPHVEMLRFVSSGTEATMSAVRLARAFTGRERILKFEGCYHGHADSFLVRAGSGVATLGLPDSPGVPAALAALTSTVAFNDADAVTELVARRGDELAAIIVEPVVGNSGLIEPLPGFLATLRTAADSCGALLIFDEVMTGFRVSPGGASERYGVIPDLTTLGKVIGGGLPAAAYGGRADIMERVAPSGAVYQAGTLSGNPLAMAAGAATLRLLTPEVHASVERCTRVLVEGLRTSAAQLGVALTATHAGSMWGFFFRDAPVRSFADAREADVGMHKRFFHAALRRGVYLAPSPFEAGFLSTAHTEHVVKAALARLGAAMEEARA